MSTDYSFLPPGIDPPTDDELAEARALVEQQNADFSAQEEERALREARLSAPITPLPVEGSTVAEVKASAETAIADLAAQMEAKIQALLGQ